MTAVCDIRTVVPLLKPDEVKAFRNVRQCLIIANCDAREKVQTSQERDRDDS